MEIPIRRLATGEAVVTEHGGGNANTGYGMIVAGDHGERLRPSYMPRKGYSNGDHAEFIARPGMIVLLFDRDRSGTHVTAYRITEIDRDRAECELIGTESAGSSTIPAEFEAAVLAAIEKSNCYHCREAHFIPRQ